MARRVTGGQAALSGCYGLSSGHISGQAWMPLRIPWRSAQPTCVHCLHLGSPRSLPKDKGWGPSPLRGGAGTTKREARVQFGSREKAKRSLAPRGWPHTPCQALGQPVQQKRFHRTLSPRKATLTDQDRNKSSLSLHLNTGRT